MPINKIDQEDFEKARKLYVQTSDVSSRKKLRNFIQNLDTAPTEEIMDIIGRNGNDGEHYEELSKIMQERLQ